MKLASRVVADNTEAISIAATGTVEAIAKAWREKREAHIVLTGGRTGLAFVQALDPLLAQLDHQVSADSSQSSDAASSHRIVNVWFSDERFVEFDSADRNDTSLKAAFEESHEFLAFFRSLPPSEATIHESADGYDSVIKSEIGTHAFDAVVLSMGEDGHVASCFPGQNEILNSSHDAVEVLNSPKPPQERITITVARLGMSNLTYIFALGEGKSSALRDTLAGARSLPITLLRQNSPTGEIHLLTDIHE